MLKAQRFLLASGISVMFVLLTLTGNLPEHGTRRVDVGSLYNDNERDDACFTTRAIDESWLMYGHDLLNSFNYPDAGPATDDTVWEVNHDADFSASPVIVDGLMYVGGTDFELYCIDVNTGETVFSHHFPSQLVSSPCVVGDMVYIGCRDYNLYAFNKATREQEWNFSTDGDVDSSPKVVGSTLYFGSLDGYMYAVDTITHSLIWKYWCGADFMIKSSPAISGNRLVFGCYNEDGSLGNVTCLDLNGLSDGNDGYAGEANTTGKAGDVLWHYNTNSGIKGSASIMGNNVFIGSENGKLHCLALEDGSLVWDAPTGDFVRSCPTPVPETNSVVFGSWDGFLYSLNASTGSTIWKVQLAGSTSSAAVVADGRVYIGDLNYHLYCFDLVGWTNLSTEIIFDIYMGNYMRCRAAPLIYNGILYQGCENGNEANNGKIVAVGRPDVKVFDIHLDDNKPYEDEIVNIEAVIKNLGIVAVSMDVEIYYATYDNRIKVLIDVQTIFTEGNAMYSVNTTWKGRPGVWKIWVHIANSTPVDNTDIYTHHWNSYQGDFTVSSLPSDEWGFSMRDTGHGSYGDFPVDTSRLLWEATPGGSLYQPVISEGFLVATNGAGTVFAYASDGKEERWRKDYPEPVLSSASVLGSKVFVPFEGFKLRCFDLINSGNINWIYENADIENPITPVMVRHGLAFVTTKSGEIFAIDDDDGKVVWSRDMGVSMSTVPLIFGDTISVLSDAGILYLLDVYRGALLARKDLGFPNPLTPAYFNDLIYIVFRGGEILSYDPVSNSTDLLLELGETPTTGLVKVSEDNYKALGTTSGLQLIDHQNTPFALLSTGGYILNPLAGAPGRCYFIDSTGTLHGINTSRDALPGDRILWNKTLGSGTNGTPVIWGGKAYVGTGDGKIMCLGAPNRAPVGVIDKPGHDSDFFEIDEIEFSAASSSDPDHDDLYYRWISDRDGLLFEGTSSSFSTFLSPDSHYITLTVDDQKGGRDHKTIRLSVLGKKIESKSFSNYDLDVRAMVMDHSGEGSIKGSTEPGMAGVNNTTEWKVLHIVADYGWVGWMELSFDLSEGAKIIPANADYTSLRLYLFNPASQNWSKYNDTYYYSPTERSMVVNLTGTNDTILTIYGKIKKDVSDIIKPIAVPGNDTKVYEGNMVVFDASGSTDNVGIVNYSWTFEDNGQHTFYGFEFRYRFDNPGYYEISLKVTDAAGNWDRDKMNVTVKEEKPDEDGSDNTVTWIVVLVLAIILIGVLIFKEMRGRGEQRRMDEKFFKADEGPDRSEVAEEDVKEYVDMFTVGGGKDKVEKKKGASKKKDASADELPDVTVGGMKVRKKGGKKGKE